MSNKPMVLANDRVFYVDVDDTLACWNLSDFPAEEIIEVEHVNGPVKIVPHKKNINTLIKFWKLGYSIIVHSASGYLWAESVVKSLNLQPYITIVMTKARFYMDDKPVETWMSNQVYRDPLTGKDHRYD